MKTLLVRWFVVVGATVSTCTSVAYAQQLQLSRANNTTTVVPPAPTSVMAGGKLTVLCDGLDCADVHAQVDTGTVLTPTQSEKGQRVFAVMPSVRPGASVVVTDCTGLAPASCATAKPVITIPITTKEATAPGQGPSRAQVLEFCSNVGSLQVNEILSRREGRQDFTVILFDETGPCFLSRQFGGEGDPIAIGYVSATGDTVSLDLDPCSTLAATPKILIGADLASITLQADEQRRLRTEWFSPLRRCFGTAAGIKLAVTKDGGQPKPLSYTLKQFERYRATLQLGVTWSELHQQTFSLRQDGAVKRIIETSADERGPEYVAAIVLYGIPRYFARRSVLPPCFFENEKRRLCASNTQGPPERENYFGRDPVNENGIVDRIGLLFGAGLNQPGRRFLVGGSFELVTGVNLLVTSEFVRLPELEGVAVGDVFAGEASTLPIRDHWRQAWSFGLALDARYAVALFTKK
jgi:hypothetical protein